jgi:F0F1-type ATP synthase membrane subunit b/b'
MQQHTDIAQRLAKSAQELIDDGFDSSISDLNKAACQTILEAANAYLSATDMAAATPEFLSVLAAFGPFSGLK